METAEACLSGWIFRRFCQKPNMWCSFHSPPDITDPIVRKRTVVCERDAVQESDPEPILTMPAHEFSCCRRNTRKICSAKRARHIKYIEDHGKYWRTVVSDTAESQIGQNRR